MLEAEQAGR